MEGQKIYRRVLISILILVLGAIGILSYRNLDKRIPDNIKLIVNETENLNFSLPMEGHIHSDYVGAISINNKTVLGNKLHVNFSKPFSICADELGTYDVQVKLFGIINFKKIKVDVIEDKLLTPCGMSVGINIKTDGVLVLGTGVIACSDGLNYEPALNILKSGDYIVEADHIEISNKKQLIETIENCGGKDIELVIRRNENESKVIIKPVMGADGVYKIGAWIRDDTQGIGTLTFVDEEGIFGALGHGITDIDTGLLMNVKEGELYKADVLQINKGHKGEPGEIIGVIRKGENDLYGNVIKNTKQGIFGVISEKCFNSEKMKAYPMGLKQEVKKGKATILCQVTGKIEEYEIEIEKIEMNTANFSKGMVIHVTDKKLLNLTNGIVQGMSGSPILQNGKIIGAVTHVFVQDSTRGYGIFVENMVKFSK
ncbi:SpoIVB peptidase [Anaeromicropila populeti]|uniref:Stage IV sporulation protein B n=1 Tax=Anaeromicropila populeti TaxID=37658 RepID=A0A1I6IKV0_9FIRM|nr:SpoIVB peptidase [Anaeromicropila populeti]SFR67346.1 stage IV sporulation protein B [Anaeromicropila populeti]